VKRRIMEEGGREYREKRRMEGTADKRRNRYLST
jgi:hypothetical protein